MSFGDYVSCGLCHTSEYDQKEAINVKKIPRDDEYQEIFNICVNSNDSEIATPFIQNLYKEFFQIVSNFNNSDYPYAQYLQKYWEELYKEVRENKNDKQLIKEWEPSVDIDKFKYAQMVSARGAEKLVIKFSCAFGYQVEDISIHQITEQSSDWKLGDIRLDQKTLLDVKNSRFTVNSKDSKAYSEFCVPKFKHKRTHQDEEKKEVYIVGVLSPYLQKQFIDGEEKLKGVENPKILGIFYQKLLEELKNIIGKKNLLEIDLSRLGNSNSYLPHWLFDYGDIFYEKQIEIVNNFKDFKTKLSDGKIPSWEKISIVGIKPLPLFILARENLPTEWESHLPKWKLEFINSLINIPLSPKKKIISLSHLYISILKHFLQMLEENNSEYNPQGYFDILYENSQRNRPLKIYDPLQTIEKFCETLQTLWKHREKTRLTEFKIFKFRHEGILQGKKASNESWKTIIAYCGGNIKGKGKCGYSPLIFGSQQNCPTCGHLICRQPDCQYCKQSCPSYQERKAQIEKQRLERS
ncbi:hypothetical protein [Okeania sp. SIO1I7]|uniref:hypothetical protein n=1 Tax=Okeania sp. SIO1I7 TaxID=2607772 RepID=UPI0013FA7F78|nr:hypothetical protein [Okeania sp. SIO1I7]NET27492.1 hypothetical protein [Okeania sp. SIO1I7]